MQFYIKLWHTNIFLKIIPKTGWNWNKWMRNLDFLSFKELILITQTYKKNKRWRYIVLMKESSKLIDLNVTDRNKSQKIDNAMMLEHTEAAVNWKVIGLQSV